MFAPKKILATFLSFALSVFLPFSYTGTIYAFVTGQAAVEYQPDGSPVLAVPVTEPTPEPEPLPSESSSSDTVDFIAEGPLSPADDEQVSIASNDPFSNTSGSWGQSYADMWWHKRVRAEEAWQFTRGAGSSIAVIDTGIDYNHPDLAANVWYNNAELNGLAGVDDDGNGFVDDTRGWDFHNGDNDPLDDHGHGSHVAGIAGAVADNLEGIAGIAPESKIIPVKVLSASGSGFVSNVISAIKYAANLGATVINMSLGIMKSFLSKSLRSALENAVKYAKGKGTLVVAAAGNSNTNVGNFYPAGIRDVIAVGATEPVTDNRAWFSNFGSLLDLVAPGVDVLSLRAGGTSFGSSSIVDPDYSRASGTSMASPIVAGVAALLKAKYPALTYDQVVSRLRSTAEDLGASGFDNYFGYGLVDAYAALVGSSSASASATLLSEEDDGRNNRKKSKVGKTGFEGPGVYPPDFLKNPVPPGNWYLVGIFSSPISVEKIKNRRKTEAPRGASKNYFLHAGQTIK